MLTLRRFLWFNSALLIVLSYCSTLEAQTVLRAPWYESHVDSTTITLSFTSSIAAKAIVWIGPLSGYDRKIESPLSSSHSIVIDNLVPATQYLAEIIVGLDTVRFVTSTSSDFPSTGKIEAYFNRSVDTAQGITPRAQGTVNFGALLRDKIAQAGESIDLAVYSFGGIIADSVVVWLSAARKRGIAVRLIADSASVHSSKQFLSLATNGIPAIMNSFGVNGKLASNIHHNKFIVIDGRGVEGAHAWVLTGSWNLTDQQTTTDYQNVIHFQDLALARGFEAEFNQEWGSSGDLPDPRYARFSTNKLDITPRSFNVGGTMVHLFFSPNRGAASAINTRLASAKRQILFALLLLTRPDIAATMISAHQLGVDIHGVVNNNDKYEQTPTLRMSGIDAIDYTGPTSILLHDKYAVIDAGTSTGAVITGSYNWSASAEQYNNENLLIVDNDEIAKLYYQDWSARYKENGGSQNVIIPLSDVPLSRSVALSEGVYPNPTTSSMNLEWIQEKASIDHIIIYSPAGAQISDTQIVRHSGKATFSMILSQRSGLYSIVIEHDGKREMRKLVLIK